MINYKLLEDVASVNRTLNILSTKREPPDLASKLMFNWMLKYLEELRDQSINVMVKDD